MVPDLEKSVTMSRWSMNAHPTKLISMIYILRASTYVPHNIHATSVHADQSQLVGERVNLGLCNQSIGDAEKSAFFRYTIYEI